MKQKGLLATIAVLLIILAGMGVFISNIDEPIKTEEVKSDDDLDISFGNITSFNEAVNAFAFNFYKKFHNDPEKTGNLFNSPYSIFTALAMTYEGARGVTAEEMKSVLNIDQDNESFHQYMQTLYTYLNENSEYNISTANALWPSIDYTMLPEYVDVIETFYGGKVTEIDYSDPAAAAEIINTWVEEQTNNLIQDLIPESSIDPDMTRLILTNAIYFKGDWKIQFDKDNTTDRDFTTSSGQIIQAQTMQLVETEDVFNYTEGEKYQVLELPYNGDETSMMIFLPKDGYDLSDVINSMDKDSYSQNIDSMSSKQVDTYIPKFEIKTPLYNLNDYLKNLGMQTVFTNAADLSGLDGIGLLCISDVLHKAYIKVNEEGTEAAAATAVITKLTSVDPGDEPARTVFDCDHPFFFTIHHKETNTVLFMGNIQNPLE